MAAQGVVSGELTLGDLVLINTMMLQLFLPLNFLGIIYRSLKYALADMDMVIKLLKHPVEITDRPRCQIHFKFEQAERRVSPCWIPLQSRIDAFSKMSVLNSKDGQKARDCWTIRGGKVDYRAVVVSFLRYQPGADYDQRPGYLPGSPSRVCGKPSASCRRIPYYLMIRFYTTSSYARPQDAFGR